MNNINTITLLESYLKKDELEKSLNVLLNFYEKINERDYKNQVIQLLGNLKSNAKNFNIGILTNEEYNLITAKIRHSIIQLKDNLSLCEDGELIRNIDQSRFEKIENYIEKTKKENWVNTNYYKLPENTIGVEFHEHSNEGNTEGVIIDLAKYESLVDILDDLYICYLTDKYKPMTYGNSWVLMGMFGRVSIILVPNDWLDFENKEDFNLSHKWVYSSPKEVGIYGRTRWKIVAVNTLKDYFALGINDDILLNAFSHPKSIFTLRNMGIIKYGEYDDIDKNQFRKIIPINFERRFFYDESDKEKNMIYQAITPLPNDEFLQKRLLRWNRFNF